MAAIQYVPIASAEAAEVMGDPKKQEEMAKCAESFRHFLKYWRFLDQEHGEVKILGDVLWSGQMSFVDAFENQEWLYALKARKLGYTTIECAFDGWVLRFRDVNARVHLFSRRQDAAGELLAAVKFGIRGMPKWMRLDEGESNQSTLELITPAYPCFHCTPQGEAIGRGCEKCAYEGTIEDRRVAVAYPADEETAVEATCTHGHVDEWARMRNPKQVWQSIEPSMAGSCHIITTGRGPTNFSSSYWRKTLSGDTKFHGHFVHALNRPDRDQAWLEAKKAGMTLMAFKQEYAMTWQDALFGGGDFVFTSAEVDIAVTDFKGPIYFTEHRKYVEAWDIGRHADAAVGVILDVTDQILDVVNYFRFRETPYPDLQDRIATVHTHYTGFLVIEKNSAGEAVIENLVAHHDIDEDDIFGFSTTG